MSLRSCTAYWNAWDESLAKTCEAAIASWKAGYLRRCLRAA